MKDFGPIDGNKLNTALENWFQLSADELVQLREQVRLLRETNRAAHVKRAEAERNLAERDALIAAACAKLDCRASDLPTAVRDAMRTCNSHAALVAALVAALEGVIRVADSATVEFDAAKAALALARQS